MNNGFPTKKKMSALWSCIADAVEMTKQMKAVGCTPEQIMESERINSDARRAYLKLNKLRKQSTKGQP